MPRRTHARDSGSSKLKPQKPYKLRRWRLDAPTGSAHFFTCARPGRSSREESKTKPVDDNVVHRWVLGLPQPNTAIVSLLGRKHGPEGDSEFSFYSFCGGFDTSSEREGLPTFQEWLDQYHKDLNISVHEHPTYDYYPIPLETLDAVKADIEQLILTGRTVIVIDSGGETRTGKVRKHMGAEEDSTSNT